MFLSMTFFRDLFPLLMFYHIINKMDMKKKTVLICLHLPNRLLIQQEQKAKVSIL